MPYFKCFKPCNLLVNRRFTFSSSSMPFFRLDDKIIELYSRIGRTYTINSVKLEYYRYQQASLLFRYLVFSVQCGRLIRLIRQLLGARWIFPFVSWDPHDFFTSSQISPACNEKTRPSPRPLIYRAPKHPGLLWSTAIFIILERNLF